jgi:hypothetical protein
MCNGAIPGGHGEITAEQIHMRIPQVLPEGHEIVELVLELVADLLLVDLVVVVIGITSAKIKDIAVYIVDRGHRTGGIRPLNEPVHREPGLIRRRPREGRLQEIPVVGNIEIGIALPRKPDQAVGQIAAVTQRITDIEGDLLAVGGAVHGLDFTDSVSIREL